MPTPMFTTTLPLVLASASPRRLDLLSTLGIAFEVMPSDADEPAPEPGESPEGYAMRMAALKTCEVAAGHPEAAVLGADTVVALENTILGKPADDTDALRMLTMLSGATHQVVTGCCLILPSGREQTFFASTDVRMRTSPEHVLQNYVATGECSDKAGAYAIQGLGAFLVEHVHGSYTNVVGLPLARVLEVLTSSGGVVPKS